MLTAFQGSHAPVLFANWMMDIVCDRQKFFQATVIALVFCIAILMYRR